MLLSGGHYVGDDNNVRGIGKALEAKHYQNILYKTAIRKDQAGIYSLAPKQVSDIQDIIHNKPALVIGAGIDGIKMLNSLKKEPGHVFIWSGHQLFNQVIEHIYDLNAIIMPESAIDEQSQHIFSSTKVRLITTIGVPHNKTTEDIIKNYYEWIERDQIKIIENSKILLVSLPGDAPDKSGHMNYYPKESAAQLGKQLGSIAKTQDMIMLVTNGPRTGQHDPITGERLPVHKQGAILDQVSESFLTAVKNQLDGTKIIFDNFSSDSPSLFNAFLGAVSLNDKNSVAVIGGESTSQVTEATNLLKPGQVYIVSNDAMNVNHHRHNNNVIDRNYAKLLSPEASSFSLQETQLPLIPTDASIAVEGIIQILGGVSE
ncbi:unnamed protein product [Rotaria sp. Silwood2]|nr:unnamed protein product [Rotaria sp. Silwood2]CAF4651870.1 unnamed protein product [Rotaria sp. Silwood2]